MAQWGFFPLSREIVSDSGHQTLWLNSQRLQCLVSAKSFHEFRSRGWKHLFLMRRSRLSHGQTQCKKNHMDYHFFFFCPKGFLNLAHERTALHSLSNFPWAASQICARHLGIADLLICKQPLSFWLRKQHNVIFLLKKTKHQKLVPGCINYGISVKQK